MESIDFETFRETVEERGIEVVPDRDEEGTPRSRLAGTTERRTYADWLTPVEEHYICHKYPTPDLDGSWTVSVTGAVDEPLDLTVAELREAYPTVAVAHTMECAGNGRLPFDTRSVQWDFGAVSTAFWTGAPASEVLRDAGVEEGTEWLTVVGGDAPEGEDVFARSLPLSKVLDDCILAYGMNGRPLPADHGYPVRLIVPGWYGVNSVKWVDEMRATDSMMHGEEWATHTRWQQRRYRMHPEGEEPEEHDAIDVFDTQDQMESPNIDHPYMYDQNVTSLIAVPEDGETVQAGTVEVRGVAWAGDDRVDRVEVSADGGETWDDAELFGPDYPCAWRLFRYEWEADPGGHELVSRATDDRGRSQPRDLSDRETGEMRIEDDEYPWHVGGYGNNAYRSYGLEVTVE